MFQELNCQRQTVESSADCQGCGAARRPPVFVEALLFIRDNNLAKVRGRCRQNYTAGVDGGGEEMGALNRGRITKWESWLKMVNTDWG